MISSKIASDLSKSSWIRAMFEEGEKLRKIYGQDKVYDFSLGNPEIEPPDPVTESIRNLVLDDKPGKHRYMSNAGYSDVREKIASHLSLRYGMPFSPNSIVMTCGAAGGLNIVLKSLLNPGDEVVLFSPFFVEYISYVENHGGIPVIVPTNAETFEPDPYILKDHISPRTKAIIINSPNNPTGVVYSRQSLERLAELLEAKEKEYGTTIYVVSDEPYREILYDDVQVPNNFKVFKNMILVYSFSKSLALAGERIGYVAVKNTIRDCDMLINAIIYCNRILGFVNAPALFQKVVSDNLDVKVDVDWYRQRRDMLYNHLTRLGFSCVKPQGAFYLFPKAPIEDDVEFVRKAVDYNLLLVPGTGFRCRGYFRIAYCVSMKTIQNSLPAFEALAREFGM